MTTKVLCMPTIPELLDLHKTATHRPEAVAIIGSGGKTALLWLLAESLRTRRVLVSTTVKMRPPTPGQADAVLACLEPATLAPCLGVTFAGVPRSDDKVESLPLPLLADLLPLFDISLLESDGAGERPYKGWADHEPVVPPFVTRTIAVMPVPRTGWRVDAASVHRLPLFLRLTGARTGDAFRPEHLAKAIAHPQGLLGKARGRTVLFFNQAENLPGEMFAKEAASLLPETCRERLALIIAGSVRENRGVALWDAKDAMPRECM